MSYQLMKNPGYFYICSPNKHNSIFSNDHHQRHRWLDSHLNEIKKETDTQKIMQPIMDHFLWHRIVVDEAHESLHDNFDSSQIELLQANFFWFVSATPFRLYNNKVLMQKLLPVEFNNYRFSYDDFDFYMNSYLLWRNTKESVKDEYEIPAYVEDIVLLQFTEIEKYAYDNSCSRCIRNYGCFDGDMPLTEYRKYLLDNNKSSVESIRESFKTRNKEYYKVQRVYKNEKAKAKKLAEIETQQENLKDNIARTLLKIENLNSIKDYDGIDISNFELPPMMSDKEEDTDQQTIETNLNKLTKDSILRMKVKQMKDILKQEKLPFPKPANKLDLQKCLISYVDNKEKAKKEKETENQVKQEKGKENEKNGAKKVNKTKLDETKKEKDNKSGNDKQAKRKHSGDDDYEENPDSPKKKAKRSKKLNKFDQVLEIQSKFTEDQLVAYYVEKYGTKIGNLLKYLRKVWKEDPTARFIIFTSEVFNIIASMLHDNGIAFANVIGNVMQREKALKTFKNSELKVIMLDTNSTVSGSNLIEASYVILMDPVQGTKEQVVTTESQAIGRAHRQGQHKQVTVVRFIMQDTSEYESYLRVYNVPAACPDPEELIQPPQLLKRQSSISILMPDATRKNKK